MTILSNNYFIAQFLNFHTLAKGKKRKIHNLIHLETNKSGLLGRVGPVPAEEQGRLSHEVSYTSVPGPLLHTGPLNSPISNCAFIICCLKTEPPPTHRNCLIFRPHKSCGSTPQGSNYIWCPLRDTVKFLHWWPLCLPAHTTRSHVCSGGIQTN